MLDGLKNDLDLGLVASDARYEVVKGLGVVFDGGDVLKGAD